MKTKGITFKKFYLAYLLLLVIMIIAALTYVNKILHQYEEMRPEFYVEQAMETLKTEASQKTLWQNYNLPQVETKELEKHLNVQDAYQALYTDGELTYSQKNGNQKEDELYYLIENEGISLAEVKLKAKGPSVTKLILFTYREWETEYVKPLLEAKEYTLTVPADFQVSVNGIALQSDADATSAGEVTYTMKDLYLKPAIDIKDQEGNTVSYAFKNNQVMAEFYNYSLTLPSTLAVTVDGKAFAGEILDDTLTRYQIRSLSKPTIVISDDYGNEFTYEGGNQMPLTYMTVIADSRYTVEVSGKAVTPDSTTDNPEYTQLADYVENLPQVNTSLVAILEDNAEIIVKDDTGAIVSCDTNTSTHTITAHTNGLDSVPAEVAKEVDVLALAQQWSLFMSADKPFSEIAQSLLLDSYQYKMAKRYSTGIDITFTSDHTLLNPAFTENSVSNFVWLTDNCFSVDISFVKHMHLTRTGAYVDDFMNDRFYFVKYDDTNDNVSNPTWKIASMKEIVNNE